MKKLLRRTRITFLVMLLLGVMMAIPSYAAAKPKLNYKVLTLTEGKTFQLKMKNAGKKKVKWKSSKKAVATVNSKGKVTAKKAGKTTITATVAKKKYKCQVTVKEKVTTTEQTTTTAGASTVTTTTTNTTQTPSSSLTVASLGSGLTSQETQVLSKLLAYKSQYPEGKSFTNSDYYEWKGGIYRGGYGCAAFAFMLSDGAFGTNLATMHYNWNNIRVGDILRVDYNTHSVIVLKVTATEVTVAEGNYNKSVHWGRTISIAELKKSGTNILTRYDSESYTVAEALQRAKGLPVLKDVNKRFIG